MARNHGKCSTSVSSRRGRGRGKAEGTAFSSGRRRGRGARRLAFTDREARELLRRYERLVRLVARRLLPAARGTQALDYEDLCAEGRVAVLEAVQAYGGWGIDQDTWVRTRIYQRMVDAVRRVDLRTRDELRLMLRCQSGRAGREAQERGRLISARRLVSLEGPASRDGEPLAARLPDDRLPPADEIVHRRQQQRWLRSALHKLPPRQRQAVELCLYEGLQLKAIGRRMGISESRVCQLQKRAVEQLRAQLRLRRAA